MSSRDRCLLIRCLPALLAAALTAAGCAAAAIRPKSTAAAAPAGPPVVTRRGAHSPRPATAPANPIARLAWEAERKRVARWIGVYAQEAAPNARPLTAYRAGEDFPAASIIKLPVMMAVYEEWSARPHRRKSAQMTSIRRMMQASDNPATNLLIDWLGPPNGDRWRSTPGMRPVNGLIQRVAGGGAPVTRLQSKLNPPRPGRTPTNRGCPWELAQLLVHLAVREKRRDPAAAEMLRIMRGSAANHRTRIPAAIPKPYRARVANKTGSLARVVNDLALIETPSGKRYVLCLLMDGVTSPARADRFCRQLTAACWKSWMRS